LVGKKKPFLNFDLTAKQRIFFSILIISNIVANKNLQTESENERMRKEEEEPFNKKSQWRNESSGKNIAVSNDDTQVHAIVKCEFVENIDPSICNLHQHH